MQTCRLVDRHAGRQATDRQASQPPTSLKVSPRSRASILPDPLKLCDLVTEWKPCIVAVRQGGQEVVGGPLFGGSHDGALGAAGGAGGGRVDVGGEMFVASVVYRVVAP